MYLKKYKKDDEVLSCYTANDDCSICNGCKSEEIYWRKANQIHHWFVQNVQNGNDDCDNYVVTSEQLKELYDICNKVLNDNSLAEKLLPSQSGFFFGGTEYDEYYFDDIKHTKDQLEDIVKSDNSEYKYVYNSSW